jgi:hypothetical protein
VANLLVDTVSKLAHLDVNLHSIPRRQWGRPEKGVGGREFYSINLEIRVKFEVAHIDYSLWHNGICYGSIEATYE